MNSEVFSVDLSDVLKSKTFFVELSCYCTRDGRLRRCVSLGFLLVCCLCTTI